MSQAWWHTLIILTLGTEAGGLSSVKLRVHSELEASLGYVVSSRASLSYIAKPCFVLFVYLYVLKALILYFWTFGQKSHKYSN